ncbi:hypothetical protein [Kitasatospora sp. NPDC057500]|uniref:hypothetical protein n=1 Tax=Kitasatospora sp. NPDC057500 TaxID=3346151 RepID=UPI00369FFBCC
MRMATRLAMAVAVLALAAGVLLVAASGPLPGDGVDRCAGQDARLAALDELDAFAVLPPGSRQVEESATAAECVGDDSAGPWLYSSRVRTYGGNREDLIRFYEGELSGLGWRRGGPKPGPSVVRTCFTRKAEPGWETLTITFVQGAEADGTFRISAEAAVDGSRIGC